MKLGRFPRAAVVLSASLLSVVAWAQTNQPGPAGQLNIPEDVQVVGNANPNTRTATAIVNAPPASGTRRL